MRNTDAEKFDSIGRCSEGPNDRDLIVSPWYRPALVTLLCERMTNLRWTVS
jgi:hypothetical protein